MRARLAWTLTSVKKRYESRALAEHSQVIRVSQPSYVPTVDDILHSRVRTSGVISKDFDMKGTSNKVTLFDVGGQRSERRKWIQYFDHVDAIVFVAAISEFDQVL